MARGVIKRIGFAIVFAVTAAAAHTVMAASTITTTVSGNRIPDHPPGMQTLPDEQTTFILLPDGSYRVFAASNPLYSGTGRTGAVVLGTTNLKSSSGFSDLAIRGDQGAVLSAPSAFTDCTFPGPSLFDQNYAALGTVIHDPTLSRGNVIMLYEAEQHCYGTTFNHNFYASTGVARSSDEGKTWRPPGPLSQTARYPTLQVYGPQPVTPESANAGDALPSGFVDTVPRARKQGAQCPPLHFLYMTYTNTGDPAATRPLTPYSVLRIARAQLGQPHPIANSQFPIPPVACMHSDSFDGRYPSFMSAGHKEDHTGLTGNEFFLSGCDGSLERRLFRARAFSISVGPQCERHARADVPPALGAHSRRP